MKTVKVTEKFDDQGRLIERTTETIETVELTPWVQPAAIPPVAYPWYPPVITFDGTPVPLTTTGWLA